MQGTEVSTVISAVQMFKAQGQAVVVRSEQDLLDAISFLGKIASARKQLDTERMARTKPLKDEAKKIEASYKPATDLLDEVDAVVRLKVSDWKRAEAIRIAEQQKQAAEAEAARLAACQNGGEITDEQATALAIADRPDTPIKRVNSLDGSAQFRKVWKFEVVNESYVPHKYFTLDEKKIRAAIASGEREIPGVRIYSEDQLAVSGA
jgi:hypothetical protein